ncbi:unnamed protein product [Polarella glacialis]|uniref:Transmembrane protein n=1 Tax=Polarella glacialis TaxID=89957 RepID=A0A813EDZ7_POLGL|nr:unnamed protein product [Polarella glacialis]
MASFSSLLGSEAFLPAASFFFGIAGAMAFVATGASATPTTWGKEEEEDEVDVSATSGSDSVPRGGDGAASREEKLGEGSAEGHQLAEGDKDGQLRQRQPQPLGKGLTLEQESRIRDGVRRLPPESRKALQDWLNMEDGNKMALLAMNCLVLILVLGMLLIGAACLIGFYEVNVFDLETWRNGAALLGLAGPGGGQHQAKVLAAPSYAHDLAEL